MNRPNDHVGIAYGQINASDDYKDSNTLINGNTEKHLELYYNYFVNEHLTISPDVQLIWDAFGDDVTDSDGVITVVICGHRLDSN